MKRIIILILLLSIPIVAKANIMCNDGTISPTCTYIHSGCCSGHGGVSYNNYSYNNYQTYDEDSCSEKDDLIFEQEETIDNQAFEIKELNNKIDKITIKNKNKQKKIKKLYTNIGNLIILLFTSWLYIVISITIKIIKKIIKFIRSRKK